MLRIKAIREEQGVSRRKLSQLTGLTYVTVYEIEKGGDVKISTLLKIAKVLHVHIWELFERDDANAIDEH